jgi:hypothetical protein
MPAPSIINTWRFNVSQSISGANSSAFRQSLLLAIVNSLLGAGSWTDAAGVASSVSGPWDVVSSSDSVVADASNRWDSSTDLVWAAEGVAHSWIVLRNPNFFGTSNPLYMLINCNPGSTINATLMMSFSRAGYTGGSITARPTATDEHIVRPVAGTVTTAGWQGDDNNSASSVACRLHVMMTDDGRKFKIAMTRASVCIAYWDLFDIDQDEAGWSEPYAFIIHSEDFAPAAEVEVITYTNVGSDATFNYYAREQGGIGDFRIEHMIPYSSGGALVANSIMGSALNGFNGRWMPLPIVLRGIAPAATAPLVVVPDSWWARAAESTGSPMRDPLLNENRYMQFGSYITPWNNSVIVLG